MRMRAFLFLVSACALLTAGEADAQRRGGEPQKVFDAAKAGRLLPLPEIERRVVPKMPGAQYLGVDIDVDSGIYTLKFLRNGLVIWVDVDGRSGQIVGRSAR
jgi:hypothetical protein